jgi:hypothetical protein
MKDVSLVEMMPSVESKLSPASGVPGLERARRPSFKLQSTNRLGVITLLPTSGWPENEKRVHRLKRSLEDGQARNKQCVGQKKPGLRS